MKIANRLINEGLNNRVEMIIATPEIEGKTTQTCLTNLERITKIPLSVYLVESSKDEFHWGRSLNSGIAQCKNDFFITMDFDCFPSLNCIENLIQYYRSNKMLGLVGVNVHNENGTHAIGYRQIGPLKYLYDTAFKSKAPFWGIKRVLRGRSSLFLEPADSYVKNRMSGISGQMLLINRECHEDVGKFDEYYRISYVDIDFSLKVLISKWYSSTCRNAHVLHALHDYSTSPSKAKYATKNEDELNHFLSYWTHDRARLLNRSIRSGKFICD